MPSLLHIDASPRHTSTSSKLSHQFVDKFVASHPGTTITHHNTTNENLPYVTEETINAGFTSEDKRSAEMNQALAVSDKLTHELLAADTLVIGTPMWNFGFPASLKSWIDLIVRAGLTFTYGPQGPSGLIPPGKKAYIFTSSGGDYTEGSPAAAYGMLQPHLKAILSFIGITDITFVNAVNQNMPGEAAAAGLAKAEAQLNALLA